MKTIPLTQGKVALVDDVDYESVSQFKWHAVRFGRSFYAARSLRKPGENPTKQFLHQFLMPGVPRIDHNDGNSLNDQRENLRPATQRQNRQGFRRKALGATSKFRGVKLHKYGKWQSQITVDGKGIYLGIYTKEEAAARAYDAAARKYFGEFASPNFP